MASFDGDGLGFRHDWECIVARILRCKYGQKAKIFIDGMIMAPAENTHIEHAKALSHHTTAQHRGDVQIVLED